MYCNTFDLYSIVTDRMEQYTNLMFYVTANISIRTFLHCMAPVVI